jgi:hypothetical protein
MIKANGTSCIQGLVLQSSKLHPVNSEVNALILCVNCSFQNLLFMNIQHCVC